MSLPQKRNALNEAVKILARRGWNISTDNRPTIVTLDSANRPGAYLAIRPFDAAYFEDDSQVLERVKESLAKSDALINAETFPSE